MDPANVRTIGIGSTVVSCMLLGIGMAACGGGSPPADRALPAAVVRTAVSEPVPYTTGTELRLVASDRACMVDSYETQIVCGGPGWDDVQRFGREGKGPGEFNVISGVVPIGAARLAVFGFGLRRLTILSRSGDVESTLRFRGAPRPVNGIRDSLLVATVTPVADWIPQNDSLRRETDVVWLRPGRGIVRRQTLTLPDSVPVPDGPFVGGAWSTEYGFVFLSLPYEIFRFSPAGEYAARFTPAHYEPELPNDRDVQKHAEALEYMFGTEPSRAVLAAYRQEPKDGIIGVQHVTFTANGLLWIATTRDRDRWSYIDVYAGGGSRFLGSIRVRDRMLAFDVRGGTLAVLVERGERNVDGIRPLAIDWYDVSGWVEQKTASRRTGQRGAKMPE